MKKYFLWRDHGGGGGGGKGVSEIPAEIFWL